MLSFALSIGAWVITVPSVDSRQYRDDDDGQPRFHKKHNGMERERDQGELAMCLRRKVSPLHSASPWPGFENREESRAQSEGSEASRPVTR